jgi:hypothetical protein
MPLAGITQRRWANARGESWPALHGFSFGIDRILGAAVLAWLRCESPFCGRQLAILVFARDDEVLLLRCDIVPAIIDECHARDGKSGGRKSWSYANEKRLHMNRNSAVGLLVTQSGQAARMNRASSKWLHSVRPGASMKCQKEIQLERADPVEVQSWQVYYREKSRS